jgi:hypothetical protein
MEIDAAFTAWHQTFVSKPQAHCDADLSAAKQVCEAYRVLRDPQHRLNYDELLIWVHSPALDPAISDEEFLSWLKPGKTIAAGLLEKRICEQAEARRLRRVAAVRFERAISSRGSWIGITCWTLTWLSGAAMFALARFSLHRILELAAKLHH